MAVAAAAAAAATVGSTHSKHLRQLLRSIAPSDNDSGGSGRVQQSSVHWVNLGEKGS